MMGSTFGRNITAFGAKPKKKVEESRFKDISDAEYQRLCRDVTTRVFNNKTQMAKIEESLFPNTCSNQFGKVIDF